MLVLNVVERRQVWDQECEIWTWQSKGVWVYWNIFYQDGQGEKKKLFQRWFEWSEVRKPTAQGTGVRRTG